MFIGRMYVKLCAFLYPALCSSEWVPPYSSQLIPGAHSTGGCVAGPHKQSGHHGKKGGGGSKHDHPAPG